MFAALLGGCVYLGAETSPGITIPAGYRQWQHVKTVVIGEKSAFFATSGGMYHVYANDRAMEGYRTGTFADGSVIVFDLLEVKDVEGNTIERARKRIDIMAKDTVKYAGTGGWAYETFLPNGEKSPAAKEAVGNCFTCHQQAKKTDYVFSKYRP